MTAEDECARLTPFRDFVLSFNAVLSRNPAESDLLSTGGDLLADLVRQDDWLPPRFAQPDPSRYQQYLLHRDTALRFCVVSFVWAPGQGTPVHNHTVWGLVGMLTGSEISQSFAREGDKLVAVGKPRQMFRGDVEKLSPSHGDIHQVRNALSDKSSISIHVYGGDIGSVRRSSFSQNGSATPFVSGYANQNIADFGGPEW